MTKRDFSGKDFYMQRRGRHREKDNKKNQMPLSTAHLRIPNCYYIFMAISESTLQSYSI